MVKISPRDITLGIIGDILSLASITMSWPTLKEIVDRKRLELSDPWDSFTALLISCWTCVVYGLPFINEGDIVLIIVDSFGLLLASIYIAVLLRYASSIYSSNISFFVLMLSVVVIFISSLWLVIWQTKAHSKAELETVRNVFGWVYAIFTILAYLLPYRLILGARRGVNQIGPFIREVNQMEVWMSGLSPLASLLMNALNCLFWFTYTVLSHNKDIRILIPNGVGFLLNLGQILLYVIGRKVLGDERTVNIHGLVFIEGRPDEQITREILLSRLQQQNPLSNSEPADDVVVELQSTHSSSDDSDHGDRITRHGDRGTDLVVENTGQETANGTNRRVEDRGTGHGDGGTDLVVENTEQETADVPNHQVEDTDSHATSQEDAEEALEVDRGRRAHLWNVWVVLSICGIAILRLLDVF